MFTSRYSWPGHQRNDVGFCELSLFMVYSIAHLQSLPTWHIVFRQQTCVILDIKIGASFYMNLMFSLAPLCVESLLKLALCHGWQPNLSQRHFIKLVWEWQKYQYNILSSWLDYYDWQASTGWVVCQRMRLDPGCVWVGQCVRLQMAAVFTSLADPWWPPAVRHTHITCLMPAAVISHTVTCTLW